MDYNICTTEIYNNWKASKNQAHNEIKNFSLFSIRDYINNLDDNPLTDKMLNKHIKPILNKEGPIYHLAFSVALIALGFLITGLSYALTESVFDMEMTQTVESVGLITTLIATAALNMYLFNYSMLENMYTESKPRRWSKSRWIHNDGEHEIRGYMHANKNQKWFVSDELKIKFKKPIVWDPSTTQRTELHIVNSSSTV